MSDLLAPLLVVMDNEVDAFWCFVGFMDMVVSLPPKQIGREGGREGEEKDELGLSCCTYAGAPFRDVSGGNEEPLKAAASTSQHH